MPSALEFYFDFSSPYGYVASHLIDDLAARHQRDVLWRPIMLGLVFKTTGAVPLVAVPLKGAYARRDMVRTAAFHKVPFNFPERFPFGAKYATRAFYWLDGHDPVLAKAFAKLTLQSYFVDGRDVGTPDQVADVASALSIDRSDIVGAMNDSEIEARARMVTEEAMQKNIFGSPFFVIDGEPFFGHDRLAQIERWLVCGGW